MNNRFYLIGPTESILTKRGNRFPNIADFLTAEGKTVFYYTSNFYHAEKRFFNKREKKCAIKSCNYYLKVLPVLGYSNNISIRRVLSNYFFSLNIFFILLFKTKKGDKIIIPSRPVELIFFVSLINRIKKTSIYLDIQDIWPDALKIKNKKKEKVFEIYCNIFLKHSLKFYTKTFHVAPSFKKWLNRYAPKVPSVFLPLGWENCRWNIEPQNIDYYKNECINLVCVAQLQHQINIMPILELLKTNKKVNLTIIGEDSKGERYQEVKEYINKNNINNFKIIGKVKREEMVNLLIKMDIGILPMITSSIPNKIFDYIASYLPIIVLGQNDSADFVKQNNIGWSCDFNSEDLIKLIENINYYDYIEKRKQVQKIRYSFSRNKLNEILKETIE